MEELLLPRSYLRRLACGNNYTMLVLEDGRLIATGENNYGQLGIPSENNFRLFTEVPISEPALAVSCDTSHTALLYEGGTVGVCGLNAFGQLGQEINGQQFISYFIPLDTERPVASIVAGYTATLVLFEDGSLSVCGADRLGRFGFGYDNESYRVLTEVSVPEPVAQAAIGSSHSLLLFDSGRVAGAGTSRALGWSLGLAQLGTYTYYPSKLAAEEVACGLKSSAILFVDGTVEAGGTSGDPKDGRLAQVGTDVASVVCGYAGVILLLSDGSVVLVGYRRNDQHGHLLPPKLSKVQLPRAAVEVAAGTEHAMVLLDSSQLWGSGSNLQGQLGLGRGSGASNFVSVL